MPDDTVFHQDKQSPFDPAAAEHVWRKRALQALRKDRNLSKEWSNIANKALLWSHSPDGLNSPFFISSKQLKEEGIISCPKTVKRCCNKMLEMRIWVTTGRTRPHRATEYRWNYDALKAAVVGLHIEVSPISVITTSEAKKDRATAKALTLPKLQKYALRFIHLRGQQPFTRAEFARHILGCEVRYSQDRYSEERSAIRGASENPANYLPPDNLLRSLREKLTLTEAQRKLFRNEQKRSDRLLVDLVRRSLIERVEAQRGRRGYLKYKTTSKAAEYLNPSTTGGSMQNEGACPQQTNGTEYVTDPEMVAYLEQQERETATLWQPERLLDSANWENHGLTASYEDL